jgi:hypothetical protein
LKFTTATTAGGPVFGSRQRRTPSFPLMVWISPKREHAPAAGDGAAEDFGFRDGALKGLARQPEQL